MQKKKFSDKLKDIELSLTYSDVLIKPGFSDIMPDEVDLSLKLNDKLSLSVPIFSAAMDTITEYEMSAAMIKSGCCGPLHKNMPMPSLLEALKKLSNEFGNSKPLAATVGVSNSYDEIQKIVDAGANILLVDSAHAHSKKIGDLVEYLSKKYPDIFLISGNVATIEGAKFLVERGAKAVKVGVGPGSICITRKVTGVGRGQLNSIAEISDFNKKHNVLTIADGGIGSSDDIAKAIASGADAVMLGFMLSGTSECPGEYVQFGGKDYKIYRGMGSLSSMKLGSASRYNKESVPVFKWVPEGIESYSRDKGPVSEVLKVIEWSLRSAFGYIGAKNISEVQEKAELVRVTGAVQKKSDFHSVDYLKDPE